MPKELTHWHIAREALKRGVPVEVEKIIASNPAVYYLGAIAHDIPFYDLSKPSDLSIEHIANQMHGVDGENTLTPLIEILEMALNQTNPKQASLAFLLGMLTHFVADSTFHPMVYYLSGNYFANDSVERGKAVFRHRLLETAIDLWLKKVVPMDYPENLNHLWREAGEPGRQAFELLIEHFANQGDSRVKALFMRARRNHRFLQTAYSWSTPRRVLALYRRNGHPEVEKLEALFYSQPLDLSLFDGTIEWLHPVSGELNKTSLDELFNESVKKVIILFQQLAEQTIEEWPLLMRTLPPLSLDTGLPYVPVAHMKFFRTEPIEYRLKLTSKNLHV